MPTHKSLFPQTFGHSVREAATHASYLAVLLHWYLLCNHCHSPKNLYWLPSFLQLLATSWESWVHHCTLSELACPLPNWHVYSKVAHIFDNLLPLLPSTVHAEFSVVTNYTSEIVGGVVTGCDLCHEGRNCSNVFFSFFFCFFFLKLAIICTCLPFGNVVWYYISGMCVLVVLAQ